MWPFKKNIRPRRIEGRRRASAYAASAWHKFRQGGGVGSVLLALLLYAGLLLLEAWPLNPFPYRKGQYVPEDVFARVSFQVLRREKMESYIARERERTAPTFQLNAPLTEKILTDLRTLPERLKATSQPADLDDALRKKFALEGQEDLAAWQHYAEPDRREALESQLGRLRERLVGTCLISPEDAQALQRRSAWQVLLVAGASKPLVRGLRDVIGLKDTTKIAQEAERLAEPFDPEIRGNVQAYLLGTFAGGEPLYSFGAEATERDADKTAAAIRANPPPEVYESHPAGEILVARSSARPSGSQRGLTASELDLLGHEHEAYLQMEHQRRPWLTWMQLSGRAGVLLLVVALLVAYVVNYQKPLLRWHGRALAVVMVVLLMLGLNKVMFQALAWNVHAGVLPVLMAAAAFAIAFDRRLALLLGGILAILVPLQVRGDLALFGVLMAAVAAGAFQLQEIRSRSKLVVTAAATALAVFAMIWSMSLMRGVPWRFALADGGWGIGCTIVAGFFLQGLLPLIERVFRIATSMTLLEWCDASKPLLKRLALESPGTYNHSLQLGTMCEAAAEAIGANGLLARAGAYYHDIGKINKPEYFAENQFGSASRHAKLSPAMSLLVIIGHVKDGLEMARRYGLPSVLWEFIAAHHGTTLVQYFYKAASDQARVEAGRVPDEVEFRYPGPKPQSKEVAILMLADASESSVRSVAEPTPGRIENQVHAMVTRRLMDGQLDECDLTLREVHAIEDSLIKSLCGVYHSRIAYPTPDGERPSAAEMSPSRPTGRPNGD